MKSYNTKSSFNQVELIKQPFESKLWNKDLAPIPIKKRTWNKWHTAFLWIMVSGNITAYTFASAFIRMGMSWIQSIFTIMFGCIIVLVPLVLISSPAIKYGITFPVLLRSSFGIQGAKLPALFRGITACAWFGVQVSIGGKALYIGLQAFHPSLQHLPINTYTGINTAHLICILIFWFIQVLIYSYGIKVIKYLAIFASPILIISGVILVVWSIVTIGSFDKLFSLAEGLRTRKTSSFILVFFPCLSLIIGYWATLALNIPDLIRFAKNQKEQTLGQLFSLPLSMGFYSFLGIIGTCTSVVILGNAIWVPNYLLEYFSNSFVLLYVLFTILFATTCCNIAANMVSTGYALSNLMPKLISYRTGGFIAGIIGLLIMPWKLIADPNALFLKWISAYSSLLGGFAGIIICDYFFIKEEKLNLNDLFQKDGEYRYFKGWNIYALIAYILAIIPNLPGLLVYVNIYNKNDFPIWVGNLYNYTWFLSFTIAFMSYWFLMSVTKSDKS